MLAWYAERLAGSLQRRGARRVLSLGIGHTVVSRRLLGLAGAGRLRVLGRRGFRREDRRAARGGCAAARGASRAGLLRGLRAERARRRDRDGVRARARPGPGGARRTLQGFPGQGRLAGDRSTQRPLAASSGGRPRGSARRPLSAQRARPRPRPPALLRQGLAPAPRRGGGASRAGLRGDPAQVPDDRAASEPEARAARDAGLLPSWAPATRRSPTPSTSRRAGERRPPRGPRDLRRWLPGIGGRAPAGRGGRLPDRRGRQPGRDAHGLIRRRDIPAAASCRARQLHASARRVVPHAGRAPRDSVHGLRARGARRCAARPGGSRNPRRGLRRLPAGPAA